MANSFETPTYNSAKTFSYIVIALFAGIGLCSIFYIIMCFFLIASPDTQINLANGTAINPVVGLIGLASTLESLLRLLVIVFFLIWEYRSFKNLTALKAESVEFSPGWAVGWWFIPLANLIKPFQAIRELWNESDPEFDEEAVFHYKGGGTPPIIGFWWAFFLLSNVANNLSNRLLNANNGKLFEGFPIFFIIFSLLQLAAIILVVLIVKRITEKQEERFSKIMKTQQFTPPPPEFYQNG